MGLVAAVTAVAATASVHRPSPAGAEPSHDALLVTADRVFDGFTMRTGVAVLIRGGRIERIGPAAELRGPGVTEITTPSGTLLPGVIDLHTHHTIASIPPDRLLTHGVTTARDVGGLLQPTTHVPGGLRHVLAGPLLTAPGGYPIPVRPAPVETVRGRRDARSTVKAVVANGAKVIKVTVEPGGSPGASWSQHRAKTPPPWPMLSVGELRTIVRTAHALDRRVTAHLSGPPGVRRALAAGVDEWAHMPCDRIPRGLLRRAARRHVAIVGTLDTESHCTGVMDNARRWLRMGGKLLYGTDMGHVEIPHGIDAQELTLMVHAGMRPEAALAAATSAAGTHLGLAPLGRLVAGAPADLVGVTGDPRQDFKPLEHPELVIADGKVVARDVLDRSR
jgi:imidazolonepropionase-like amidohydrolase